MGTAGSTVSTLTCLLQWTRSKFQYIFNPFPVSQAIFLDLKVPKTTTIIKCLQLGVNGLVFQAAN